MKISQELKECPRGPRTCLCPCPCPSILRSSRVWVLARALRTLLWKTTIQCLMDRAVRWIQLLTLWTTITYNASTVLFLLLGFSWEFEALSWFYEWPSNALLLVFVKIDSFYCLFLDYAVFNVLCLLNLAFLQLFWALFPLIDH